VEQETRMAALPSIRGSRTSGKRGYLPTEAKKELKNKGKVKGPSLAKRRLERGTRHLTGIPSAFAYASYQNFQ
jgi:hypothetical protein